MGAARSAPAQPGMGAAPSAPPPQPGMGAAPSAPALVYAYHGESAAPASELAPPAGLAACSVGYTHTAALTTDGAALCAGSDSHSQLGTGGGGGLREHFAPAPLPWAAGQISSGAVHTLVLQRGGGAVCSWGGNDHGQLGRGGAAGAPGAVQGLPAADPVAAVAAGVGHSLTLTQSGAVYGWGVNLYDQLGLGSHNRQQPVALIAGLSARGARRIAAGHCLSAAETGGGAGAGGGALLCAGGFHTSASGPTAPLPAPAVSWPLRALAAAYSCSGSDRLAAADAQGAVWLWTSRGAPARAALPPGERAVQIALSRRSLVALTEGGQLWDCTDPAACWSISAAHPELARGLVPCGGAGATSILLVPLCGLLGGAEAPAPAASAMAVLPTTAHPAAPGAGGQPAAGGGAAAEPSADPGAAAAGAAAAQCAECAVLRGELAALQRQLEERDAEVLKLHDEQRATAHRAESAAESVRRLEAELAAAKEERTAAAEAAAAREAQCTALQGQVAELGTAKAELARRERAAAETAAAQGAECERLQGRVAELEKVADEVRVNCTIRLSAAEAQLAEQREARDKTQGDLERQLAELRERLAAAETAAAAPCSPVRRYFDPYAGEFPAHSPAQVDAMTLTFLLQCEEIDGAGTEKEFLDMHKFLKNQVDDRIRELTLAGADFGGLSEAAVRMTHYWSANEAGCATFEGERKEFCGWINLALVYEKTDRPLRRAMAVIRTLNEFCVTAPKEAGDGAAAAAKEKRRPGPAMDKTWAKISANGWKLYRGGGLRADLKDWFTPGLVYRQPRYLSASLNLATAKEFAMLEGAKAGRIPVLWEIEIDEEDKCCHINHLRHEYSFYPEDELLFPPRSVFTVKAVSWAPPGSSDPSRITLCAAPDSKLYPLNLPAAPWS